MTTRVVSLDFPGRRAEARIADLRMSDFGIEVVPLMGDSLPTRLSAREYAAELLSLSPLSDHGVRAIFAYCAAAPIAQEVAQLMLERGDGPLPVVFFDADPCEPETLWQAYVACIAQVEEQVSSAPLSASLLSELLDDPRALVGALERDLADRVTRSLTAEGFTEEELTHYRGQIMRSVLDYLVYLVAAHHSASPSWGGRLLHVVSEDHPYCGPWEGAPQTRLVRVKCDRAGLLRHPDAVEAALAFVTSP
ncbi:hypothetical protein [Streptomyces avicenniae]|uniref:hypothetical protein n=1 Tax=Streptomyces avicenniae TaxID=500153 RepID=UPI00167E4498|nr:hypothetical protein [Streptomyces avicenniae]